MGIERELNHDEQELKVNSKLCQKGSEKVFGNNGRFNRVERVV